MQRKYYKNPKEPKLQDSKILFDWVISSERDDGRFHLIKDGPEVRVIGHTP